MGSVAEVSPGGPGLRGGSQSGSRAISPNSESQFKFDASTPERGPASSSPVNEALAEKIRSPVERHLKRKLATFKCVQQLSQAAAGTTYYFKVHVGNDVTGPYIWVKAFAPLPSDLTPGQDPLGIVSIQTNKNKSEQ